MRICASDRLAIAKLGKIVWIHEKHADLLSLIRFPVAFFFFSLELTLRSFALIFSACWIVFSSYSSVLSRFSNVILNDTVLLKRTTRLQWNVRWTHLSHNVCLRYSTVNQCKFHPKKSFWTVEMTDKIRYYICIKVRMKLLKKKKLLYYHAWGIRG